MEPGISPMWVFLVMLLSFVVGCWIGVYSGMYKEHASAVEAGVGEYVVDPKTGIVSFVWKVCK